MVKAACKFTPDWLIIVQLLTAVTLTLLAFDADIVTCESIIPHEFSGVDKHHPNHNSESQVSVLVAATQRDETGDNLSSSPHTLHAESGSSFVSQNQQLLPNVGWVTAASRQKNVPTEEYSDFRTSRPYFFHMKAKISHTVTHELKKSTTSEQKSIKEDIPLAETTFLAERIRDSSERHSKFESGSQKLSEKALTLPPVDRELIEVNSSFQNEKRPFDDSVNNSFSNKSIANAQEVYDSRYTSELYEENFNAIHETLLSSDKLIRNFTCNMSSFVEDSSHDIEVNKSGKTTSDLRDLLKPSQNEPIKVINITPNTYNRWSSQEEHSSDLNVSSEMNNESITTANTNGVDINVPIQGSVRSLALSHTEADRKLFRVSDLINSNVREGEISNSLLEIENLLHLDRNSNGSSTREIFSAAQTTALTKLSRAALSSEPQKAESRTHKVEATEDRLDSANGIEESLNYEVIVSEVNGSWVDTGGGNISEKTRRDCFKVEGETDFVSNTDTVTSVSSTSSEHDSRQSEIWTLGSSGNVRVNSNGAATVNDGYDAPTGQDIGGSDMLVQKQNGDMSSEIRLSKDNLRSHKTRHISLLKLFKIIANESVLRSGQNNSIFVKHKLKDLNTKPINVPYEIYFTNDSTKDAENLSFDSNVLQAQIVKPVVYFGNVLHRPGNNKTSYVQSDVSEDANEANITHSEDTKLHQNASFELTEDIIREMPTLTSEQLQNDGNSTDYSNIKYLNNPSEDVTFNANLLMNFIASTNNGLSYTGNYDKNYNTSTSGNVEIASTVTEHFNSSEVNHEFFPIHPTTEATSQYNVEVNTFNYYDFTVSTPEPYDKDVERWDASTHDLSAFESLPNYSVSDVTEASVSGVSPIFSRNDSASDGVPGWPVKLSAEVSGDLILGGLMMVHERQDNITCGPIMPQGGIQALETMLYTLDVLNKDQMIPNVTIGAHILDDCDKDTYGLEMAVDFIKGSISNIDGAEYHCNKTQVRKVISGVVGAASSVTSIQVANLLRLFKIPQVSFFSTSPELSNKQRFEFFSRTIPSDHYQVKAMVDIVRRMGWSYVSIIYEESNYGLKAFEELETLLAKHDICIAVKEKLVKDSGVADETAYDIIVQRLLTKPRARGAIIFGSDQEVAGVMRAVRRNNATGSFSWIGSDGWSARNLVSDGNEPEVEGTLSVQPQANPVRGFEEYFLNLTVESNRRNPWFVEFWEGHFHCRYPNSSLTPYNKDYKKECDITERLHRDNTAFEGQLQFVSDAVMAFAHAFRDMHHELCKGRAGLCDAMKPIKGTELLKYLRKVTFKGLSGDNFRFDPNGDGPARYNIIHFKQTSPGKFQWIKVGEYMEGELRLNMSEIQFKLGHPQPPESVCSLPCDVGQAKKFVEGESCCWHCFNCTQYQIQHPVDETQCLTCREGTVPDASRVTCREIPEVFLRPESGPAIGAMSLSSTGILITLFVCGVFVRHNDTPVVRASGRELSYVLLTGILLCYCVTFALVLRPTDVVCGIQRFGAGFCFTVVYAALLTKTNRIARIFNAGKRTAKRPSFISPRSQLFICSGLVGVQVLINGVWILVSPPRAVHHYPTREDNHLVCSSHIDASYMIAFGYPILLIIVCTIYAVLTRKIPEAFNESKHIGFTMYTTCVIWLAFVPLYFGTGNHVPLRITSMSVTISLSASVTLACLFSPKLYIILVHPERNVRQSMMPVRYNATKSPAVTGTTQTGSMMAAVICNQQKQPFHSTGPQQSGSSQGLDSGLQSDGVDLELREDVVHQLQRRHQPCLLVNRSTQTMTVGVSNNSSNANCPNSQPQQPQQQQQSIAKLTTTCHIINSSSNGPISISATQQKQQIKDVQL